MSTLVLQVVLLLFTLLVCAALVFPFRKSASFLVFLTLLVLVGSAYFYWGGFTQRQAFLRAYQARLAAEQLVKGFKSPEEVIQRLQAKLAENPGSAKGWYLLGRLYSGQNKYAEAVLAFKKARQLEPGNVQYEVNYGQALWQMNQHQFSPEIIGIFQQLLQTNPNQPDALAMLAMEAYTRKSYQEAISYWRRLLKQVPQDSEDAMAIRKAIIKAEKQS